MSRIIKQKEESEEKWHDSKQSGLFPNIAAIIEQQYREGPMYSYLLILGANTDSKVIYAKYYKHWKGGAQNSHLHTELEASLKQSLSTTSNMDGQLLRQKLVKKSQ